MEFVSGFKGNWQHGPPRHIAAQFVQCLISTLKESDASRALGQILLPTDESIQTSLFNARFLGRKLYLLATLFLETLRSN